MRTVWPALTLAAILLLSACAGPGTRIGPDPGLTGLAGLVELKDLPFHPQEAFQCGPAALATMLNGQGVAATPESLQGIVYLPDREGSLQVEMVAAARSKGMLVYPLESLEGIIAEVAAGNPVLVLQNLRLDWWPQWHYAVVMGYDLEVRELILRSGTEARKRTAFRTFDNTWARGGRWARLVLKPGQLPATAEPLAYVRAAYDLEQTGQFEAARASYHSASLHWPDNLAAGFARANLALSLAEPADARVQFLRLLERHPRFAPAWNNLALSLDEIGCPLEAEAAKTCAQRLAPDDARLRQGNEDPTGASAFQEGAGEGSSGCAIPACPVAPDRPGAVY